MCLGGGAVFLVSSFWSLFSNANLPGAALMPVVAETNIVESEEFEVILDTRGASAEVEPASQNVQLGCGPQVF